MLEISIRMLHEIMTLLIDTEFRLFMSRSVINPVQVNYLGLPFNL